MIFVDFIFALYAYCELEKKSLNGLKLPLTVKVTRADSGLAHADSCKSLKCIAHNFLVPALLGSRALLG